MSSFFPLQKHNFELLIPQRLVAKKIYSIKHEVGRKPDIEAGVRKPQTWWTTMGNPVNHHKAAAASPAAQPDFSASSQDWLPHSSNLIAFIPTFPPLSTSFYSKFYKYSNAYSLIAAISSVTNLLMNFNLTRAPQR